MSEGYKDMLIRVGYDIEFYLPCEVDMLAALNVHP